MNSKTISIEINGQPHQVPEHSRITDTLQILGLGNANIVAELDGEIIPKNEFSKTILKNGAKLELVRFVGGG